MPPSVPTILVKIWHPSICQETWAKWVSFKPLDVIVVVTGIGVVKQPVTGIHTILGCDCDKAKQDHVRIHKLSRTILLLTSHQTLLCDFWVWACIHPIWSYMLAEFTSIIALFCRGEQRVMLPSTVSTLRSSLPFVFIFCFVVQCCHLPTVPLTLRAILFMPKPSLLLQKVFKAAFQFGCNHNPIGIGWHQHRKYH